MTKQPGFSERLWLDVYRLRFAANLMRSADEVASRWRSSLRSRLSGRSDPGDRSGLSLSLLGNDKDAANHGALRDDASEAAEKDSTDLAHAEGAARSAREGDTLVNVGFHT